MVWRLRRWPEFEALAAPLGMAVGGKEKRAGQSAIVELDMVVEQM